MQWIEGDGSGLGVVKKEEAEEEETSGQPEDEAEKEEERGEQPEKGESATPSTVKPSASPRPGPSFAAPASPKIMIESASPRKKHPSDQPVRDLKSRKKVENTFALVSTV